MNRLTVVAITVLGLGVAGGVPGSAAQDWPQWRGPNRDGATTFSVPGSWPEHLEERWRVEVGTGHATPVLVGDVVYMFTRMDGDEDEVMTALDAGTGERLWQTRYPAPFELFVNTSSHGAGPKSTPTYADGRLFTLGMSSIVTAFEAETGRLLWQHPAPDAQPRYHTAMSPVVDGDLVMVHIGGPDDAALTAFDVASGAIRWAWKGDGPAYGSPIVTDLGGTRQVVTFTHRYLVGIAVATGELLWRRPFTTPRDTTAQTPILYGDMLVHSGRARGVTAFRLVSRAGEWGTEDVWHTDDVALHMTNGVAVSGVFYGLSHLNSGQYFALDLDSGDVLWTSDPRQAENAAFVRSGNTIFSLEDDAEMVVLKASRTAFEPVRRYEVATSPTWAQPAIVGDRFYVKDVSTLALLTLE